MQTLLEYAPWIVFFVVYKFGGGIYPATAALMGAMTLLLAYYWLRTRKVPQMHLALTILVLVFGAATLILRDVRFLQWKASVIYWLIGILFAGSVWIGKKTLLERAIGAGLPEDVTVPAASWRNASLLIGRFLRAAGVREHLGRQDAQRGGLGHLQGLDRGAAGDGLHRRRRAVPAARGIHERVEGIGTVTPVRASTACGQRSRPPCTRPCSRFATTARNTPATPVLAKAAISTS